MRTLTLHISLYTHTHIYIYIVFQSWCIYTQCFFIHKTYNCKCIYIYIWTVEWHVYMFFDNPNIYIFTLYIFIKETGNGEYLQWKNLRWNLHCQHQRVHLQNRMCVLAHFTHHNCIFICIYIYIIMYIYI